MGIIVIQLIVEVVLVFIYFIFVLFTYFKLENFFVLIQCDEHNTVYTYIHNTLGVSWKLNCNCQVEKVKKLDKQIIKDYNFGLI